MSRSADGDRQSHKLCPHNLLLRTRLTMTFQTASFRAREASCEDFTHGDGRNAQTRRGSRFDNTGSSHTSVSSLYTALNTSSSTSGSHAAPCSDVVFGDRQLRVATSSNKTEVSRSVHCLLLHTSTRHRHSRDKRTECGNWELLSDRGHSCLDPAMASSFRTTKTRQDGSCRLFHLSTMDGLAVRATHPGLVTTC